MPALPEAGHPKNYQRLDGPRILATKISFSSSTVVACRVHCMYTFLSPFPVLFHSFSAYFLSPPPHARARTLFPLCLFSHSHVAIFVSIPSVPSLSFFVSSLPFLSFKNTRFLITPIDRLRRADNALFCTVFACHCRGRLKFKQRANEFLFAFTEIHIYVT